VRKRLVIGALAAARLGTASPAVPYTALKETDGPSGLEVLVLRHEDRRAPARSLEARILPSGGANLFSLKLGDDELLVQPPTLGELAMSPAGTPILYPTPNRVRDAKLEFEGRRYEFTPNSGANFIHGLVRRRPWQSEATADRKGATARLWIDWDASQPDFAHFPIEHRLTVSFTVRPGALRIAYAVENRSQTRLPFGFGLHPWFRVPGERKDVFLRVPAAHRMEAEERLPTGNLLPVQKTPFDLRKPTTLDGLDLDDVYFGLTPDAVPSFEWRDRKIRVTFGASREFTHLVVFTPPTRPTFCIENQTSSTDAHNLFNRGKKREAHLLIVDPGKISRGAVDWKISRISGPSSRGSR
jgi:aldose 1-epimerase